MEKSELIPNLFRSEFSRIVSVLCKSFGIQNIELAEDIASETFLTATETWSLKGIPENPKAWLYAVAKNKAKDWFKRSSIYREKIIPSLTNEAHEFDVEQVDLTEKNIADSQLNMLFAICDPSLAKEAQIALALRILCGLGIDEIASALLTSKSTINKRLQRAKKSLQSQTSGFISLTSAQQKQRQEDVLRIIYLLFNEGYYSSTVERNTRKHLCLEAMALLLLLIRSNSLPEGDALMALFCFHSSRFDAREDEFGNFILYEDQDTTKWSTDLIQKGEEYLKKSARGGSVSKYHLEATIAFWHSRMVENDQKWPHILQVYNRLLQIDYSPIAALNRTYALSKVHGKQAALQEALKIDLNDSHLYHALLADLYQGSNERAFQQHLKRAIELSKTESERSLLERKLNA